MFSSGVACVSYLKPWQGGGIYAEVKRQKNRQRAVGSAGEPRGCPVDGVQYPAAVLTGPPE